MAQQNEGQQLEAKGNTLSKRKAALENKPENWA